MLKLKTEVTSPLFPLPAISETQIDVKGLERPQDQPSKNRPGQTAYRDNIDDAKIKAQPATDTNPQMINPCLRIMLR